MSHTRSELGFRRWAAKLFDQQMWCFGKDITSQSGNVLLDLGMCYYRNPNHGRGSSLYVADIASGFSIFLWSFGVMCTSAEGSVFIRRSDFSPKWSNLKTGLGIHNLNELDPLEHPCKTHQLTKVRLLLVQLVSWFAKYEHWISENIGSTYRSKTIASRSQSPLVSSNKMATAWEQVAKQCKQFKLEKIAPKSPWNQWISQLQGNPSRDQPEYRPPSRVVR
jgi:hypothetical protein